MKKNWIVCHVWNCLDCLLCKKFAQIVYVWLCEWIGWTNCLIWAVWIVCVDCLICSNCSNSKLWNSLNILNRLNKFLNRLNRFLNKFYVWTGWTDFFMKFLWNLNRFCCCFLSRLNRFCCCFLNRFFVNKLNCERPRPRPPFLLVVGLNPREWVESCYYLSKWRFDWFYFPL